MVVPRTTHFVVVIPILQHIRSILFYDLYFSTQSSLMLHAYSNADWAGNPIDRHPTTSYYFFLEDSLISWCCMKQTVVSRSSTKVEYRALADTTSRFLWL